MAHGVPVVASRISGESFGFQMKTSRTPVCMADTLEQFKTCVLTIHTNKRVWLQLQRHGIAFIEGTHKLSDIAVAWSNVIQDALQRLRD
jgi:hypothetical protein